MISYKKNTAPVLESEGVEVLAFGLIKDFKVFDQSLLFKLLVFSLFDIFHSELF